MNKRFVRDVFIGASLCASLIAAYNKFNSKESEFEKYKRKEILSDKIEPFQTSEEKKAELLDSLRKFVVSKIENDKKIANEIDVKKFVDCFIDKIDKKYSFEQIVELMEQNQQSAFIKLRDDCYLNCRYKE